MRRSTTVVSFSCSISSLLAYKRTHYEALFCFHIQQSRIFMYYILVCILIRCHFFIRSLKTFEVEYSSALIEFSRAIFSIYKYLQTAQYRASCKQGAMPVLNIWYRAEGWRSTGMVQPQSWDQVSANNRCRSNASTEPVQISMLAWYRCLAARQYWWENSSQVTIRSRAGGRPRLCQHYASTAPVLKILCSTDAVTSRL